MVKINFKFHIAAIFALIMVLSLYQIQVSAEPVYRTDDKSGAATFFDPLFKDIMEKYHIPGMSFVMVQNSDVVYEKGYGFADIGKKTPVDPENTCFFIGSVGKVFTATAVMQLYEQGLIKLDDDVNKYLGDFKIKTPDGRPVTVANLLTHTGGFDESNIGIAAENEKEIVPLGTYLAGHMPPCIRTPGETYCYSNYGMALAGYLVERISGLPFNSYIEKEILEPLDMQRSSSGYAQNTSSNMAQGYIYSNGKLIPSKRDILNISPAAPIYAAAGDIAHFMAAQLQDGTYNGVRILKQDTLREMQTQHFTYDKNLPGIAYGFHERYENNLRALEHTGGWTGFTSYLFLLPEQKTGFFLTFNVGDGINGGNALDEVAGKFLDHYYPEENKSEPVNSNTVLKTDLDRLTGTYRFIQYGHDNIEKISSLLSQYKINVNSNGTLEFSSASSNTHYNFVEVEPLLFKGIDKNGLMLFKVDGNNRITGMTIGLSKFEKLSWYETVSFQMIASAIFILVFFIGFILWLVGIILQNIRKKTSFRHGRPVRLFSGITCGLNLVFLIGFVITFLQLQSIGIYGLPEYVTLLFVIPFISIVLAVTSAIFIIIAWLHRNGDTIWRIYHSFIAFISLMFIPFLLYWNLIGFRY